MGGLARVSRAPADRRAITQARTFDGKAMLPHPTPPLPRATPPQSSLPSPFHPRNVYFDGLGSFAGVVLRGAPRPEPSPWRIHAFLQGAYKTNVTQWKNGFTDVVVLSESWRLQPPCLVCLLLAYYYLHPNHPP